MGLVMSIVQYQASDRNRRLRGAAPVLTVGKAVAIGGGLVCLGVLLSPRKGFFDRAAYDWPDIVTRRINNTYFYYFGALAVAAVSGWCCSRSDVMMEYLANDEERVEVFCTTQMAVYMAGYLVKNMPYSEEFGFKHIAALLHASIIGVLNAPLSLLERRLVLDAAWLTAASVAELTLVSLLIPSKWVLRMTRPILVGYFIVDVAYLASMFTPPTTRFGARARAVDLYGGLLVYTGYVIYLSHLTLVLGESLLDTHGFDPVSISNLMFVGTMNLFVRVTALLVNERPDRRGSSLR